jgi:hypothetical protein
MRAILAGLPLVVVLVAACASPVDSFYGPGSGATTEGLAAHSSCSLSRSTILASASPARQRALERGFKWLDAHVPYSQSKSYGGYRTDCSGFVSMCWELGQSTTTAAMNGGSFNQRLGSYDDLIAADALLKNGHVALFVGWNDSSHASACLLEEGSSATGTQIRAATVQSLKSQGYKPVRAQKLASDTGASTGGSPPADPTSGNATPPADTPPTDDPQDPGTSTPAPTPTTPSDTPDAPAPGDPGDTSCWSNTMGADEPELTCVHSQADGVDEQCHDGLWYRGVSNGEGPFGACGAP